MKRAIILLCAFLMVVGSMFVVGCGGNGGGEEAEVKAAAEKFMTAFNERDAQAVVDIVSESDAAGLDVEEMEKEAEEEGDAEQIEYELGEVEIDGDTAVVESTWKQEGTSMDIPIHLVKENGSWKVDLEKTMSMGMDE